MRFWQSTSPPRRREDREDTERRRRRSRARVARASTGQRPRVGVGDDARRARRERRRRRGRLVQPRTTRRPESAPSSREVPRSRGTAERRAAHAAVVAAAAGAHARPPTATPSDRRAGAGAGASASAAARPPSRAHASRPQTAPSSQHRTLRRPRDAHPTARRHVAFLDDVRMRPGSAAAAPSSPSRDDADPSDADICRRRQRPSSAAAAAPSPRAHHSRAIDRSWRSGGVNDASEIVDDSEDDSELAAYANEDHSDSSDPSYDPEDDRDEDPDYHPAAYASDPSEDESSPDDDDPRAFGGVREPGPTDAARSDVARGDPRRRRVFGRGRESRVAPESRRDARGFAIETGVSTRGNIASTDDDGRGGDARRGGVGARGGGGEVEGPGPGPGPGPGEERVGTAGETLGATDAGERGSAQSRAGEVVGGEEGASGGATRGQRRRGGREGESPRDAARGAFFRPRGRARLLNPEGISYRTSGDLRAPDSVWVLSQKFRCHMKITVVGQSWRAISGREKLRMAAGVCR